MIVHVKFFAVLKEKAGVDSLELDVDGPITLDDLFSLLCREYPFESLKPYLRGSRNLEFVGWETELADGDEVAFIPPVSGGSAMVHIQDQTIEPRDVRALVSSPTHGAVVTFEGVVRNHNEGHEVDTLLYEVYEEMALSELAKTRAEAETRWPVKVAIHHRVGLMHVGDIAVVIAVGSPHRKEAFEAAEWVIDHLKQVAPIWKKETGPDGATWVGLGP